MLTAQYNEIKALNFSNLHSTYWYTFCIAIIGRYTSYWECTVWNICEHQWQIDLWTVKCSYTVHSHQRHHTITSGKRRIWSIAERGAFYMAEKSYGASHNFFSDKDPDCCPKARWNPPGFGPLKKWLDETVLLLFTWPSWKWHSFTHLFYSSILWLQSIFTNI